MTSAKEAISLVTDGRSSFDIIMVDVVLPDIDGHEMLPQIRNAVGNDVAIVMASAHSHVRHRGPRKNQTRATCRTRAAHCHKAMCVGHGWQLSLVQLCIRRGADAFLIKPLGSEDVRHIWQFIKGLPMVRDEQRSLTSHHTRLPLTTQLMRYA